ncbi:MAG: DUF2238 domain-containing protein [Pseudomonadales bacterium]|nr:DUF2238 domain-containing protein [Pseudomonadales bacterium]MBO6596838.1 DUF2238 domain-containing protein [Pseudomonadales bacterium]MBO6823173.1 DUF2238 domain-containing protein [Pseudomonadales bacterium]
MLNKLSKQLLLWLVIVVATFIGSAIDPKDGFTWFLETLPAVIALILLAITWEKFRLTQLACVLILVHCVTLMIDGPYSYAEVPFLEGLFGMERNNHDTVGQPAQGFGGFYELFEWWVAKRTGQGGEAFLDTQGDEWDTQSDLMFALIGAISALLLLSKLHDRQIREASGEKQT